MITRRIFIPVTLLSGLSLALGFYLTGPWLWPWALGSFALGLLWLAIIRLRPWTFHILFLTQVGLSIYALLTTDIPLLVLLGLIATLASWDMACFLNRLSRFTRADISPAFEKSHLLTLLLLSIAGASLAVLAMSIRLGLNLITLLILGLLTLITLSILAGRLLRSKPEK